MSLNGVAEGPVDVVREAMHNVLSAALHVQYTFLPGTVVLPERCVVTPPDLP